VSATPIVPLGRQIYRIPTLGNFINSFAIIDDDDSVTLIDCGLKRAPGTIVRGLAAIGKSPQDVTRILLTHAHADHAGGAAILVRDSAAMGIDVHRDDAPFIRAGSSAPADATTRLGALVNRLPGGGFEPVKVARELTDGEVIDIGSELEVIHTPGHTPGHISLLHRDSGVLITGDSIWNMRSRITWPIAAMCTSYRQNAHTAHVLAEFNYTTAAFTHGPEISSQAREAVRGFLQRNPKFP
jgi:glyoxylase-like metal-dependent hydrolase (beta-lactamase superfamily II)